MSHAFDLCFYTLMWLRHSVTCGSASSETRTRLALQGGHRSGVRQSALCGDMSPRDVQACAKRRSRRSSNPSASCPSFIRSSGRPSGGRRRRCRPCRHPLSAHPGTRWGCRTQGRRMFLCAHKRTVCSHSSMQPDHDCTAEQSRTHFKVRNSGVASMIR